MRLRPAGSVLLCASVIVALRLGADEAKASNECPVNPTFRVGYTIKQLNVTGTTGENRPVQVELWYPARSHDDECEESSDDGDADRSDCHASAAVYTSRLNGVPLLPMWTPLGWTTTSSIAFRDARIFNEEDARFPVLIFSHGNQNNAFDYAYTLEAMASHGYIVAAADHVNNTQDEVRIDAVNTLAKKQVLACFDGLAPPCFRADVRKSMVDRYHDVTAILDALPTWFGKRVDMNRVGMLGHSRGTVTTLSVAGGSTAWGFSADSRVKAIMGLSIGAPSITFSVDIKNITVPALLVGGSLDRTAPPSISQAALLLMSSKDKMLTLITNAVHRHFDSAYCAQMQSSGSIAQSNAAAVLDLQTVSQILTTPTSGLARDYCTYNSFTNPTDITPLVQRLTGFKVTASNVPTRYVDQVDGLSSDAVKDEVVSLATAFFGRVLNKADDDERPFSDCLDDSAKRQPDVPEPTPADLDEADTHADDPD